MYSRNEPPSDMGVVLEVFGSLPAARREWLVGHFRERWPAFASEVGPLVAGIQAQAATPEDLGELEEFVPHLPVASDAAVRDAEAIMAEPSPSNAELELTYAIASYWARLLLVVHYTRRDLL